VSLLDVRAADRVPEVGSGPGRASRSETTAAARQIVGVLEAAAFVAIRVETFDLKSPVACVVGAVANPE
jgi:hypothetical protein